jgi:hypothetical protein
MGNYNILHTTHYIYILLKKVFNNLTYMKCIENELFICQELNNSFFNAP